MELPNNKDAEKIILGTVMIAPQLLPTLLDGITREDFFVPSHAVAYAAIRDLYQMRQPIDPIMVLDRAQAIEAAEGRTTGIDAVKLSDMLSGTARITDEFYLLGLMQLVKDSALRRRLIRYGEYLATQAQQPDVKTSTLIADMHTRSIEYGNDSGVSSDLINSTEAVSRTMATLEEQWSREDGFLGLRTGFKGIDDALQGLRGGSVYIIASATSMGKTTLVLGMINGILQHTPDAVGLVVSMEMSVPQLMTKILSTQTRIASQAIDSGRNFKGQPLDHADRRLIMLQSDQLAERDLYFLEGFKAVTPAHVAVKLERIRAMKRRVDFLVVDYLQLMSSDNAKANSDQYEKVGDISRKLKVLAMRMNIPVIAISQLSREHARRQTKGYQLSDLRGAGNLEQDADAVIFLEPEDWTNEHNPGRVAVIAKNRTGPKDVRVPLVFFGNQSRFESVEKGESDYAR